MKALISPAVRRPVSTLMAYAALVILGLGAVSSLGMADLPEVRPPRMVVSTAWPGLPASEVRELLTKPLEDVLAGVRGLKSMESVSRQGMSTISLEFHWGSELRTVGVELREAVDAAWSVLPADAAKPVVLPVDPGDEVLMVIGIFPRGGDLAFARRLAEREIRTRLQQVRGTGAVVTVGGRLEELQVELDRERLGARNLSLDELAEMVAAANYDYPAGVLVEGSRQLAVKTTGTVGSARALGRLWCGPARLEELGRVAAGMADPVSSFSLDGREGVGLYVHRQPGVSPLEAAGGLAAELERIRQSHAGDLEFVTAWDGSQNIRRSLRDLARDGLLGIAIAFAVLWFFMRDLSASFIIMSAVPLSILASLVGLKLLGRTINLMSIGGLALGIGLMIDNSVAIIEHLGRGIGPGRGRLGKTPETVIARCSEISMSSIGSTAVSVIVFVPILFLPGLAGAVFSDLALSVILAQLASFTVSLTIVPALFLVLPQKPERLHDQGRTDGLSRLEAWYVRGFGIVLRRPAAGIMVLAALAAAGGFSLWRLPVEFMPQNEAGAVDLVASLPEGMTVERSAACARDMESRIAALPGVVRVYGRTGGEDNDAYYQADPRERAGLVRLRAVLDPGSRTGARQILEMVRSGFSRGPDQSGLEWDCQASLPAHPVARLLGLESDIPDLILRADSPEQLETRLGGLQASRARLPVPAAALRVYPSGSFREMRFVPDRDALARARTSLDALARAMRGGCDGLVASRILEDGRPVPVRLRMADHGSWQEVLRYPVRSADGRLVEAAGLGRLEAVATVPALYRLDRQDACRISAPDLAGQALPEGGSRPAAGALQEQAGWFGLTILLILALLYLFLGAQLQSFTLPALLMLPIPLAFGGIFVALLAAGSSLNLDSILGIVVLFGVVINNSLMLYESFHRLRGLAGDAVRTVLAGSRQRLRPIVISVVITVGSLLPLALDKSGASSQSSMAVAIIGGLSVSTVLTLFVMPLVFLGHFRRRGHA